jgi:hypothetical protein
VTFALVKVSVSHFVGVDAASEAVAVAVATAVAGGLGRPVVGVDCRAVGYVIMWRRGRVTSRSPKAV